VTEILERIRRATESSRLRSGVVVDGVVVVRPS